jgi:hypothetical protein
MPITSPGSRSRGVLYAAVALVGCHTGGTTSDATVAAAPGTLRWVRSLSDVTATSVVDSDDGLFVSGPSCLVERFDAETGAPLSSKTYGHATDSYGEIYSRLMTLDATGAPLLFGGTVGDVDVGSGPLPASSLPPLTDSFIGRYGPDGPSWIARLTGDNADWFIATAPGPNGTVYVAGTTSDSSTLASGQFTQALSQYGVLLARFDTRTGAVDLVKSYGDVNTNLTGAASHAGELVLGGGFFDTLALGGASQPLTTTGAEDLWVAKLDTHGDPVWAVRYGGSNNSALDGDAVEHASIAMDSVGDIYVAGVFTHALSLGAFNLTSLGSTDGFVAKLHGSDGSVEWARDIGTPGEEIISNIAIDRSGHVAVSGASLNAPAGTGPFIANFDSATGAPRWHKLFLTGAFGSEVNYGRNGDIYALIEVDSKSGYDFGVPLLGDPDPRMVLARIVP